MISNLFVLDSSEIGVRDLYWANDLDQTVIGYNMYRAFDAPRDWSKINISPIPGKMYRDQTQLEEVTYAVQPSDWIEFGSEYGRYSFKVPERLIYSGIIKGRASIANSTRDVKFYIDGVQHEVAGVEGMDGIVRLRNTLDLRKDGGVIETRSLPDITLTNVFTLVYYRLRNFVDIYQNGTRTFYTVVPVGPGGAEKHAPGAMGSPVVNTMEVDAMDYMQAEMVRRNAWLFEQVAEPAYLFIRRTKGSVCHCIDKDQGTARTGCKACYETGVVGGYYGPIELLYIDPDSALQRTVEEGGQEVTRTSRSYLGRTPIVQDGDLVVRRNGERLVIHNVTYKSPRGVLLQQEFDTSVLKFGDSRYMIPMNKSELLSVITTYDPAFIDPTNPVDQQPVTDPKTDPTKLWENTEQRPQGRTTTFGRVQT